MPFCADLKAQGNFNRVMVMTFSESGRRVEQNASAERITEPPRRCLSSAAGYGRECSAKYPSLTQLYEGDLMYNVDFRSVYATALERWLRVPSQQVPRAEVPDLTR